MTQISSKERITPERALLASIGVWLVLYALAPLQVAYPPNFTQFSLLLFNLISLFLGLRTFSVLAPKRWPRPSSGTLLSLYLSILILGAIGFTARLYDWFVLRDLTVGASVMENRAAAGDVGASGISIIAAVLAPFTLAAFILQVAARRSGARLPFRRAALALGLGLPILTLLLGSSRSAVLATGTILGATFLIFARKIRIRELLLIGATSALMIALFNYAFSVRLQEMGVTLESSVTTSGYTYTVPLQPWYLHLATSSSPFVRQALLEAAHYLQYLLHGVFEFFYLLAHDGGQRFGGLFQFFVFAKAFQVIGLVSGDIAQEMQAAVPRLGIYTSAFGSVFHDFGWASPVFLMLWGAHIALVRRSFLNGNPFSAPLYVFLLFWLLILPVENGLAMAAGVYSYVSFVALWITSGFLRMMSTRTVSSPGGMIVSRPFLSSFGTARAGPPAAREFEGPDGLA